MTTESTPPHPTTRVQKTAAQAADTAKKTATSAPPTNTRRTRQLEACATRSQEPDSHGKTSLANAEPAA